MADVRLLGEGASRRAGHGDARRQFLARITGRGTHEAERAVFEDIDRQRLATERFARESLLEQGSAKYGEPTAVQLAAIADLPRLKRLAVRLIRVDSWDALLKGR